MKIKNRIIENREKWIAELTEEIKSLQKPSIMVFNKIDNYEPVNYNKDDLIVERDSEEKRSPLGEKVIIKKSELPKISPGSL